MSEENKPSLSDINNMVKDVKFAEERGFSRHSKPLTASEVRQLEKLEEYVSYEKLLEERGDLIVDISIKQEILNNLDNSAEEYQGGLRNYKAKELNTLYGILTKVISTTVGFLTASIIYNGPNILKTPRLWMYLGTISVIYLLISYFEYTRYGDISRKEKR